MNNFFLKHSRYLFYLIVFLAINRQSFAYEHFSSMKTFKAAMMAFKEHNYYAARLLLQENIHKDKMGEYGDDSQYYLALSYYYEEDYDSALFEFNVMLRDYPMSNFIIRTGYWLGECYYYKKDYAKALESHYNFLKNYPESARSAYALYTIGYIYTVQKRYDDAVVEFENGLKKYPDSAIAKKLALQLGIAHFNNKDYNKARKQFQSMIIQYGSEESSEPGLWIGKTYYAENKLKDAVKQFEFVIQKTGDKNIKAEAIYNLSLCNYKEQNLEKSLEYLDQLIKDYPLWEKLGSAYFRKGQILHEQKKYSEAGDNYSVVIKNYPENEFYTLALEFLADTYQLSGKSAEALKIYETIENSFNYDTESEKIIIRKKGVLFFSTGDYERSAEEFKKYYNKFPAESFAVEARYMEAQSLFTNHLFDKAINVLNKMIKDYPASEWVADARFLLGEIYFSLNDYPKALSHYTYVTKKYKKHRRNFDSQMGIGWCYFELKQYARASDVFRKAEESAVDDEQKSRVQLSIASCRYNLRDFKGALEYYSQILEKYKSTDIAAEALFQMGWIYYRQNDFAGSKVVFDRYIGEFNNGKRLIEVTYFQGWNYYNENNYEKAAEYFLESYIKAPDGVIFKEKGLIDYAKTLYVSEKYSETIKYIKKFESEFPDSVSVEESYYVLASSYIKNKNPQEVLSVYNDLKSRKKESLYLSEMLRDLGDYYRIHGQIKKADEIYARMLTETTIADEQIEIGLKRVALYSESHDYEQALAIALALLDSNLEESDPYRLRIIQEVVKLYTIMNRLTTALEFLESQQVIKRNSESLTAEIIIMEARVLITKEEYEKAIDKLKPLFNMKSHQLPARYYTALCYYQTSRMDSALDFFRQVSERSDEFYSSWSLFYLGQIYFSRNDYLKAAREYTKIVYLYSANSELHEKALFYAAKTFFLADQEKEFTTYKNKLLEIYPESFYIKELESLKK